MRKCLFTICAALAAAACRGADDAQPLRHFRTEAKDRPHLLIVNVGGALPGDVFGRAAERAASAVMVNCWTNSIPKSMYRDLLDDPGLVQKAFGDKARVVVFVERNEKGGSFVNTPGSWSMVNLRGLDRDGPDAQKYEDRCAKMILKGIAHAAGAGASLEQVCAMYYGSFTLAGLDKVKVVISPMSYFPMLETLQCLGGHELVTPQQDYDEPEAPGEEAAAPGGKEPRRRPARTRVWGGGGRSRSSRTPTRGTRRPRTPRTQQNSYPRGATAPHPENATELLPVFACI